MSSQPASPQSSRAGKGARRPRISSAASGEPAYAGRESAGESAEVVVLGDFHGTLAEPQCLAQILVVDSDATALRRIGAGLSGKGYSVATASTLEAAKRRFEVVNPELVVAAIRLGAFNGLHLAAWLRFNHPQLPVIITHTSHDMVLEGDARHLGAAFVIQPFKNPEFWQYVRWAVGDPHLHEGLSAAPQSGA